MLDLPVMDKKQELLIDLIIDLYKKKYKNQSQFAKAAGCSRKSIYNLEKKEHQLTVNLLCKIANALDVKVSELTAVLD